MNEKNVVIILSNNKDGILILDSIPSFIIYNDEYEDDNFNIYIGINSKKGNNTYNNKEDNNTYDSKYFCFIF